MISSSDIEQLLHFKFTSPTVSLYLDVSPDQDYISAFKALIKDVAPAQKTALAAEFKRLETYIGSEFKPGLCRGLALFSNKDGLWQALELPQSVNNQLAIAPAPHLAPFLALLSQYHRYGVVLISADRSRFFEVFLGQIEEIEVPAPKRPRLKAAVHPLHQHLAAACDQTAELDTRRGWNRVILGLAPEMEPLAMHHLHTFLRPKLIVDTALRPTLTAPEVLEKIQHAEREARKVRESVLVHRVIDLANEDGLAATGLEKTLEALQNGQVRMLLVRDGFAKMGRKCVGCGFLVLGGRNCPSCSQLTEPVFNLVSEIVQLALELHCEVYRILHDANLDGVGRIGAELRFTNRPPAARTANGQRPHVLRSASSSLTSPYQQGWTTPPIPGNGHSAG